ncbi:MAG: hypothetical protein ACPHVH_04450, partial [Candidatus Kariarchaeum pelagius]
FNYKNEIILHSKNTLNFLNNALAKDGFSLEISKNYKLKIKCFMIKKNRKIKGIIISPLILNVYALVSSSNKH